MYKIEYTSGFKRDYKLALKRRYKEPLIQAIIGLLANGTPLPSKNKPYKLTGEYKDCWECHIQPDWLLIWQINVNTNTLILIRTGTHSDLF
jgi:mRNA interferase YafQ